MNIDRWPIVSRAHLVQTFRPGERADREGPFRTMRRHSWSTVGVRVVTREADRASGRFTIFSVLNVEAARCARDGHERAAVAIAKAAFKIEKGRTFARLRTLLSGRSLRAVTAAVEGDVPECDWPELHDALRSIARETRAARRQQDRPDDPLEVVAGTISESQPDFLVLEATTGHQTYVPRWLAQSAHRAEVGQLLALVTDKLDDTQMVVRAVPGIDIDAKPGSTFTPFGRGSPVRRLTPEDARLIARDPAPLRVLVPVAIER